ncbi:MAG: hypothetical protein ACTSR0_06370 [Candidatus Asgardarchaeia archaeon]
MVQYEMPHTLVTIKINTAKNKHLHKGKQHPNSVYSIYIKDIEKLGLIRREVRDYLMSRYVIIGKEGS